MSEIVQDASAFIIIDDFEDVIHDVPPRRRCTNRSVVSNFAEAFLTNPSDAGALSSKGSGDVSSSDDEPEDIIDPKGRVGFIQVGRTQSVPPPYAPVDQNLGDVHPPVQGTSLMLAPPASQTTLVKNIGGLNVCLPHINDMRRPQGYTTISQDVIKFDQRSGESVRGRGGIFFSCGSDEALAKAEKKKQHANLWELKAATCDQELMDYRDKVCVLSDETSWIEETVKKREAELGAALERSKAEEICLRGERDEVRHRLGEVERTLIGVRMRQAAG